jgi:hypothetical protein
VRSACRGVKYCGKDIGKMEMDWGGSSGYGNLGTLSGGLGEAWGLANHRSGLPIHLDTLSKVVSLSHKYIRSVPASVA